MNTVQKPWMPPTRADLAREDKRSLMRTLYAVALSGLKPRNVDQIIAEHWPDDVTAKLIAKAAVAPIMTTTSGAALASFNAVKVLPSLAPGSAAVRLFSQCMRLDFEGVQTYSIPRAGTFPLPPFVGESAAFLIVQGDLDAATIGPTKKMMFGCSVTGELESYSVESGVQLIERLMSGSSTLALDLAVWSNAAADAIRPPGLLNGIAPAGTATTGGGLPALVGDIKMLIGKIAEAGLSADNVIFVANPVQAISLRLLASPTFMNAIYGTTALAAGTVVAVLPDAVASGYSGLPQIEQSKHASPHMDDVPLPIVNGGTMAAPVRSSFQTDTISLRLRLRCAWGVVAPGGVQYVTGTTW